MGASQRKEAVAYFSEFATAAAAPSAEDFTSKLTLYGEGLCSGSEFLSLAKPIVEQMVLHNNQTFRLQWLLQYTCQVLEAVAGNSASATPAQLAALRVTELTMRHVLTMMKGNSTQLLALLEGNQGADPSSAMCQRLLNYVVKVTLDTKSAPMHAAVVRLMLTLTSSALHHSTTFAETTIDVFTEMMMSSSLLTSFLGVLLDRTVAWGAGVTVESPLIYAEGCEPGLKNFFGIFGGGGNRTAAAQPPPPNTGSASGSAGAGGGRGGDEDATYFSITMEDKNTGKNIYANCPTFERTLRHSASLLAVLVAHQKGNGRNPALDYLTSLANTNSMPFSVILMSLGNKVPSCPALCFLLYVFLYDHPTFLHDALRANQKLLLEVIERILFITFIACGQGDGSVSSSAAATENSASVDVQEDPLQLDSIGRIERDLTQYSYPFINFMTSTLMLILSQDRVVNQLMCDSACETTFSLTRHQRPGSSMPVGSLAVQVLCTGIIKAVNERNEPLAAVFAPCMANMAVFTHHMDTYTAQRLVALLLIMLRKIKLVDAAYHAARTQQPQPQPGEKSGAPSKSRKAPTNPYLHEDVNGLAALGDMLVRQLRMVVEAIEGMLRGRDRNNEALIYELLYERDKIILPTPNAASADDAKQSSKDSATAEGVAVYTTQMRQVLANLASLIVSYETEIASAQSASSPKEIIAVIKQCNRTIAENNKSSGNGDGVKSTESGPQSQSPDANAGKTASSDVAVADLLYSYEESPHSYDFFGPFVWSTLLSDARWPGGMLWCKRVGELALFSP